MSVLPPSSRPSRGRYSAASRLGVASLLLLVAAAILLAYQTYTQVDGLRQASDTTRASVIAQASAVRIANAIEMGVPLEQLVGVTQMFAQRFATYPDVDELVLYGTGHTVLARLQRPARALSISSGESTDADATTLEVPVMASGRPVATVGIKLRAQGKSRFALDAAAQLLPALLLLAALAFFAARYAETQGSRLRDLAVQHGLRRSARGRYDRIYLVPARRAFDLRAQRLSHITRTVHERVMRVRRLLSSLRQTEPQHARRERLDQLWLDAHAGDIFSEKTLRLCRVFAVEAQATWLVLLTTLAAVASLSLVLRMAAANAVPAALATALFWLVAAGFCAWVLLRAWKPWKPALTACGLLIVSPLITGWVEAAGAGLGGGQAGAFAAALSGTGAGMACGAAIQAVRGTERLSDAVFLRERPGWFVAIAAVFLLDTMWLGPGLAGVSLAALGPELASFALCLPAVCAAVLLPGWKAGQGAWSRCDTLKSVGSQSGFSAAHRTGLWVGGVIGLQSAAFVMLSIDGLAGAAALVLGAFGIGLMQIFRRSSKRISAVRSKVNARRYAVSGFLAQLLAQIVLAGGWQSPAWSMAAGIAGAFLTGSAYATWLQGSSHLGKSDVSMALPVTAACAAMTGALLALVISAATPLMPWALSLAAGAWAVFAFWPDRKVGRAT